MSKAPDLSNTQQYQLIEKALYYLDEKHINQPTLAELAEQIGLSEFYFQRLFSQWVGISPKRFLQFLSKEYIKSLLTNGYTSLDAGYQAGLSSGSRIHELFISTEAISPAQYRSMGKDLVIDYGFHPSPFGEYLLATTNKGICQLNFLQNDRTAVTEQLKQEWGLATVQFMPKKTLLIHQQLFKSTEVKPDKEKIRLLLKGTNFQIQVWQALLKLPYGSVSHYEGIASLLGKQKASRAAASAIAKNKIGYLIPCHRVVRKIGESGEYRWGSLRKKAMLAYEGATKATPQMNEN